MKRLALAAMLGLMALAPAQAQTVVKYLNLASIPEEVALMNEAAREYEALNPGVKIELPFLENEAFKAKLTTLLQSSDAPDIVPFVGRRRVLRAGSGWRVASDRRRADAGSQGRAGHGRCFRLHRA